RRRAALHRGARVQLLREAFRVASGGLSRGALRVGPDPVAAALPGNDGAGSGRRRRSRRRRRPAARSLRGRLMKVLILGVNGFIGSALTERILKGTDWQVFGL